MRLLFVSVLFLSACGGSAASTSSRATTPRRAAVVVAVLTVTATTETSPLATETHARIVRVMRSQRGLRVVDPLPRPSDAIGSAGDSSCADDVDCLKRLGSQVGAADIVTVRLAELGRTLALRMTLVDARRGTEETSMQRIITASSRERVLQTVDAMAHDIAERLSPSSRPREDSGAPWWTWPAVASGIAVAAGVTTFVILSQGDDPEDDPGTVIVPP